MSNYEEFLPDLYKAIAKHNFVSNNKHSSATISKPANNFQHFADIETVEECKALFEDLCTYKEVEQMAQRLRAAKLLLEKSKIPHRIMNKLLLRKYKDINVKLLHKIANGFNLSICQFIDDELFDMSNIKKQSKWHKD